jgi:hypothetical protein
MTMQSELVQDEHELLSEQQTCVHHTLVLERTSAGYLTGWYVCTDCWQRVILR